jgi:hypothetical protein
VKYNSTSLQLGLWLVGACEDVVEGRLNKEIKGLATFISSIYPTMVYLRYIYIHTYTRFYICMYIFLYIYVYVCIYIYVYIYTFIHTHTYKYVYMHIYTHRIGYEFDSPENNYDVQSYKDAFIYIVSTIRYIHTYIYMYIYACMYSFIYIYVCTHIFLYTYLYV